MKRMAQHGQSQKFVLAPVFAIHPRMQSIPILKKSCTLLRPREELADR